MGRRYGTTTELAATAPRIQMFDAVGRSSQAIRSHASRRRALLVWVLFLAIPVMFGSAPAFGEEKDSGRASVGLSLPEAVRIALEKNPSVQAADAYSQAVVQGITVSRAGRYPRLDFSEGFTRGNDPVYVFGSLLTQRQFTAANFNLGLLNVPPPLDNFRTQFSATMPLYDFGRTSRKIRDAKLDAQGVRQAAHRTRQEIIFSVVQAYFNALLAREDVAVAQTSVDQTQADLTRAQTREEQGLAVPSDVLSAQVQLAQSREGLLRAQNAAAIALAALNVAMGLPEDAPTNVTGRLNETAFDPGTLAERQSRALALRPDYRQAELVTERARNGSGMARADFLPKLDLFSSWEVDNQTFAARGGNDWALGATLNFNLFDGGANRARLAQSKALERRAEALKSQMASGIRLQVREAYVNLDTARQRVEVTRDAVAQSEESLRIIQNRYEAGLATITDLLRAEADRASLHQSFLNAVFDYRLGYAALELATGELAASSPAVTR
jgi:outer membrane protein